MKTTDKKAVKSAKKSSTPPESAAAGSFDLSKPSPVFTITHMQILDEQGNINHVDEPDLKPEKLKQLYEAMVLARAVDDRLLKLQRQGRIGTVPLCKGHEAINCASTLAMNDDDWFVGSYRDQGGRLMRGEPIENAMLYYNGCEEGATFPGGERTLPVSIIIGAQLLHAVGIAYAARLRGETNTAVVCHFGDGATSEGDFHEALNFASVWQVPVVFICTNNQWAISLPREKQTRSQTIAQKAIAYEMPGVQVDGNDALAVYQATHEALERARRGEGPTLIEAVTYRVLMHTTADDPTRYQEPEELANWEARDPLPRLKNYLVQKKLWDDSQQEELDARVKQQVDQAVANFESRTDFKPDAPFDYVFGTEHHRIEEQRAEFLNELNKESADG